MTVASRPERATSHTYQACVAAKNGRVDARIGIARQCTAQMAGMAPNQPEARPSAVALGRPSTSFKIVPDSTLPTCMRVNCRPLDPNDLMML